MPVLCRGQATIFLLNSVGSVLSFPLNQCRLKQDDVVGTTAFFIEARNVCLMQEYFENCLVGVFVDGLPRLGVTYYIDFDKEVVYLWLLCLGKTLDCDCKSTTDACWERHCGFHDRFETYKFSFEKKENFFFLNQLNVVSYLRSTP